MTDEPLDASEPDPADLSAEAAGAPIPAAEEDLQPTTDPQVLKPILEALIFASPDPLTLKEAASLLVAEASKAEVEQALTLLRHDYELDGIEVRAPRAATLVEESAVEIGRRALGRD